MWKRYRFLFLSSAFFFSFSVCFTWVLFQPEKNCAISLSYFCHLLNGLCVQRKRELFPCWKSASFSVINPQIAREIIDWEEWSVSPNTPCSSTQQLRDYQWSLMCSVCGRDDVKNTSPSFSLVPDKGNGESPCSPWHWQALSVHSGTVTEFLCTTLRGEERQSIQIFHAQILLFKTGSQTLHTVGCWELLVKWTQSHDGWEREGFRVLQNGKEFSNRNNFKIILVEIVEVLSSFGSNNTCSGQTTAASVALLTTAALFLVEHCLC